MKFTAELPLGVVDPAGEFQSMPAIAEMAGALEKARIDACFITDHPAPDAQWLSGGFGHDALDPFAGLAFVAAASRRLMLHTNIVVLGYRSPLVTAKGAATVQVLSGGRLILGVGVGYQKAEFDALGVDFRQRGVLADEALRTIRRVWAGEIVEPGNEARPVPDPAPPIWVGGSSGKALDRAARWGDGWCPFYATPGMSKINAESGVQSDAHLAELIDRLRDKRAGLGKADTFDIVLGPRMRIKAPNAETAERFLAALDGLRAAGVTWATVNIAHPSRGAYVELVEWFGEEVVAKVQNQ
ncbi:TIGR03619 family F420-dependent LLM class oxidoreductase [Novosphingobium sp. G106]|uniref:TIGR03619 family F420-dependent LLM class oxidoreductase n=1 Tax=Novosphingobium sp. G106 TaxID=2849500 RepID=UPI001C2D75EB|nr:TIGR03619 family F420-dependent LLM class oxidoreductase [Novosphingobium sp. G106]MBV1688661.1 TIGR03619 family F420-dependent LLM class oxidoreductase [Novosphingobium sp. G106]